MDKAAAEMGIDRLTLRRRNLISPRDMPYKTASDMTYDSGDFAALIKQAFELADGKGFESRKRESRKRGKLRGLGIGNFLETTAPPSKELAAINFNADGTVTIATGTLDFGMGHATPFAQVLSEKLGIPFEQISWCKATAIAWHGRRQRRLKIAHAQRHRDRRSRRENHREGQGDRQPRARSRGLGHRIRAGRFVVAGTDRSISIMELAQTLRSGSAKLPADTPQSLDVTHISDGPGPRPSPMAATSPKSRSIPRPASSRW